MIPALWLIAAAAAIGYGLRHAGRDRSPAAALVKTASTAILALLGLLAGAPPAIILGLALGAVGDFALTRDGTRAFLAGMLAFALGHLAYVLGFVGLGSPTLPEGLLPHAVAAITVLALIVSTEVWLAPHTAALRLPVRIYGLVIGAMALAAIGLPSGPGRGWLWLGVALFIASDAILALRIFRLRDPARQRLASRLLWPLYWSGQALILHGALRQTGI